MGLRACTDVQSVCYGPVSPLLILQLSRYETRTRTGDELLESSLTITMLSRGGRRVCARHRHGPVAVDEQSGGRRCEACLDAALIRASVQTMDRLRAIHSGANNSRIANASRFSRPLASERPFG